MSDAKALAEFEENSARLNTSPSHKRWLLTTPEGRAAYTREQRARLSPKSQVEFDANVAESELEDEAEVQKKSEYYRPICCLFWAAYQLRCIMLILLTCLFLSH